MKGVNGGGEGAMWAMGALAVQWYLTKRQPKDSKRQDNIRGGGREGSVKSGTSR